MADWSHWATLAQGARAWNAWQKKNFQADPDLSEADMSGMDLQGFMLYGANLTGAILRGTDLRNANLKKARLTGAVLEGANLEETALDGANLQGADLRGALNLKQGQIDAAVGDDRTLVPPDLRKPEEWSSSYDDRLQIGVAAANAWRANRSSVTLVLESRAFEGKDLRGIDFRKGALGRSSFRRSDLSQGKLSGCDASGSTFEEVQLLEARLEGANLSGARFDRTSLARANLRGADLTGAVLSADLADADFLNANLAGADLRLAKNLTQRQIDGAYGAKHTRLPEGLAYPIHWMDFEDALARGVEKANAWREKRRSDLPRLSRRSLRNRDLRRIYLAGMELGDCDFTGADLRSADLRQVKAGRSILQGANLLGADLRDADLSRAAGLVQAQIDLAVGNGMTRLPHGLANRWRDLDQDIHRKNVFMAAKGGKGTLRISTSRKSSLGWGRVNSDDAPAGSGYSGTKDSAARRELAQGSGPGSQPPRRPKPPEADPLSDDELARIRAAANVRPEGSDEGGRGDVVDCSVFAPSAVPPGIRCRVQVFLHLHKEREEVAQEARLRDRRAEDRGRSTLRCPVRGGARIRIHLEGDGLEVEGEPWKEKRWYGRASSETFVVRMPETGDGLDYLPRIVVFVDKVPVGHIDFEIQCTSNAPSYVGLQGKDARPYRRVFFSYSSKDRPKVALVARGYSVVQQEFFQDILNLDPGERWESKLYLKIEEADLFLLFWSEAARESEWVHKEVEYALSRESESGAPVFMPFPLEGPPPPEPWPILKERHIGDPLYYRMVTRW